MKKFADFSLNISLPIKEVPTSIGMCAAVHESAFKEIISERLTHCRQQLFENIANNTAYVHKTMTGEQIETVFYDGGGHYSVPVAKRLQKAMEEKVNEWDLLVWQQIVRAKEQVNYSHELFMCATEILLCGASNQTPHDTIEEFIQLACARGYVVEQHNARKITIEAPYDYQ